MNDIKPINVNGYDTLYSQSEDGHGKFFLIAIPENADKSFPDGIRLIDNHLIKEIDYLFTESAKYVKAYY